MAVPPLAEMLSWVLLATLPPSTPTEPPQVSPTPMALPALPPLLTSPIAAAPPLADAVATPPFPAEAVSVNCMMVSSPLAASVGGDPCRTPTPRGVPGHASIMRGQGGRHMREITYLHHLGCWKGTSADAHPKCAVWELRAITPHFSGGGSLAASAQVQARGNRSCGR